MSQASSSNARNRHSSVARSAQELGPLAVVDAAPLANAVDLQAPIDDVTGLLLIRCLDCRDVNGDGDPDLPSGDGNYRCGGE